MNGVRRERRSGTRDPESTSSTRSTASFPATARAWRTASASRLRLFPRADSPSVAWSLAGGPVSSARRLSEAAGPGSSSSFGSSARRRRTRVGAGAAQRRHRPPAPAPGQPRAEPQAPQAPSAALRVGEQAIDEQGQRPLELRARDGLGQLEPLHQLLVRPARAQGLVDAARHPQRPQARLAEAVGDRRVGERRELAQRAHPESLELLRQVGPLPLVGADDRGAGRPAGARGRRASSLRGRSPAPCAASPAGRRRRRRAGSGPPRAERAGRSPSAPAAGPPPGFRPRAPAGRRPRRRPRPAGPARPRRRSPPGAAAPPPRPPPRAPDPAAPAPARGSGRAPRRGASRRARRTPRRARRPPRPPAARRAPAPAPAVGRAALAALRGSPGGRTGG